MEAALPLATIGIKIVPSQDILKTGKEAKMTTTRKSSVIWEGSLTAGKGKVSLDSSKIGTFDISWPARSEEPNGVTSPEELIAAAHASCFAMALSNELTKAGTPPTQLRTAAEVDFKPGTGITEIRLRVSGDVPGLDAAGFSTIAHNAKENCPVSQALKAVPIKLTVE
ncbi:MAG TPA: OsmC family peroxiredoxin [Candidatus Nanopelagicaceae bacterium]